MEDVVADKIKAIMPANGVGLLFRVENGKEIHMNVIISQNGCDDPTTENTTRGVAIMANGIVAALGKKGAIEKFVRTGAEVLEMSDLLKGGED